ncbi:type I DNA topoisomerase [Acetobacteroides hydrogenigenes]|uniref:DNA topoisomerase 1 n=1 Tax=Acetobacteroides hydrogenigenes TaxID=979970 RepID=A0A4R2E6J2_9BACT|nr:type I DNA topoisomerase [Acetobacteroides hydrogenigenes]TCN63663.1 DNA topoisomerase-1 [Acetobacteroides hydrogenigenes]
MQENLVIVESPAKAKTIEKFLGESFLVKSSYGHIRDLSKKNLGIDIEHNFLPEYIISDDKIKVVQELRSLVKKAKTVWLASDEDREGEAIAWHLAEVLELDPTQTKRIVFHEITKEAIQNAIKTPRTVDLNLVNAQQARRILDRLVGFELSPLLWKKVKPSLSAGRVQSVAVRLIVEREREIMAFTQTSNFRVTGQFEPNNKEYTLKAELDRRFEEKEQAHKFLERCIGASFSISNVDKKPGKRSPAAPFTTSTLQQEAGRKLGYSVSQTMTIAQKLYEAGLITYMRTDSVNLSDTAISAAEKAIKSMYGAEYHNHRQYRTKAKGAQEAHEAIRPTYMENATVEGTPQERRLYELIWKRTIASQMSDALTEKTTITIGAPSIEEKFVAAGEIVKFDGFLKVYKESADDESNEDEAEVLLPPIKVGEHQNTKEINAVQRFAQRPPRYAESSLVKKMEELGIGRPSTYAPTISTIINRGYVIKEDRAGFERNIETLTLKKDKITEKVAKENYGAEKAKLFPSDIGMLVTDFLSEHFSNIMNYDFTAKVEKDFDIIAEGKIKWEEMIRKFYSPFHKDVELTMETSTPTKGEKVLGVDPKTGKTVSVRIGRFGPIAQLGSSEEEPVYAGLQKGQLIETITLEEALKLFEFPRNLGEYEGKAVQVGIGRFGPYVKHASKYVSIPKTDSPSEINLERAIELIEAKRKADSEKVIKTFNEEPELQVLNGRFGPYIAFNGANYKIPKTTDPKALTLEDCRTIVESQATTVKAKPRAKATGSKATTAKAKASTTKKASSKTAAPKKTTTKKTK